MRKLLSMLTLLVLFTQSSFSATVNPPSRKDVIETYNNLQPQDVAESFPYSDGQVSFILNHFFEYERVIPKDEIGKVSQGIGNTDWFLYLNSPFRGRYVKFKDFVEEEKRLESEVPGTLYPTWDMYDQSLSRKENRLPLVFYGESCIFQPNSKVQKALKPRVYYSFAVKQQVVRAGILKLLEERIAEEERELFQMKKLARKLCGGESYYPAGQTPTVVDDKGTLLHTDKNISRSSCLGKGGFGALSSVMGSITGALSPVLEKVAPFSSIDSFIQKLDPQTIVEKTVREIAQNPNFFNAIIKNTLNNFSDEQLKDMLFEILRKKLGENADLSYYKELYSNMSTDEIREAIRDQIYEYVKSGENVENILPKTLLDKIKSGEIFKEYLKKTALELALKENPEVQKIKQDISALFKEYLTYAREYRYWYEDEDYYEMTKCLRNDNGYLQGSYYVSNDLSYVPTDEVKEIRDTLCRLVSELGRDTAEKLFNAAKTYANYNAYGRVSVSPDGKISIKNMFETASIGLENLVFDKDSIDKIIDSVVDVYFAKKYGLMPDSLNGLLNLSQKDFDYVKDILDENVGETIKQFYGGFPSYRRDDVLYYKPITSRIQYFGREYSKEQEKERADYCTLLVVRLENVGQEIRMQKRLLYNLSKKYSKLTKEEKKLLKGE